MKYFHTISRILTRTKIIYIAALSLLLSSCTYVKYAAIQAEYARIQRADPGQVNRKHMLNSQTFYVYGKNFSNTRSYHTKAMAIAAFSSQFKAHERVDTMFFSGDGTHYGLNLPSGEYSLVVFVDENADNIFSSNEVAGLRTLMLSPTLNPDERVIGNIDIQLKPTTQALTWVQAFHRPAPEGPSESLFYPSGTIRTLDDPIFDDSIATMGMYDPASFLAQSPTMFYALEEDIPYKIPVVFVHGISGSARDFSFLLNTLDREKYKPWFFHYPSGGDLDQLSEFFYQIFLSGKVIPLQEMPLIVIAHSMGGLVVREAINKYRGRPQENKMHQLITLATPFGGHAAAAVGEKHGLIVLPSWVDLNPNNAFISHLFRKPLPTFTSHELIYAYKNAGLIKLGDNSDGVVSLSSQLYPHAQDQSHKQTGFNTTHRGILHDQAVAEKVMSSLATVKNTFPEAHLNVLKQGGYADDLSSQYTPQIAYSIRTFGKYFMAMYTGQLTPNNAKQRQFVDATNGRIKPKTALEKAWVRFLSDYPEYKTR